MAITTTTTTTFEPVMFGRITADVYIGQDKIASPGDLVQIGDLAQSNRTLCLLEDGRTVWIEDSAFADR